MSFSYSNALDNLQNAAKTFQSSSEFGFNPQPTSFIDQNTGQLHYRAHVMLSDIVDGSKSHGYCYYNAIAHLLNAANTELSKLAKNENEIGERMTYYIIEVLTRACSYFNQAYSTSDTYPVGGREKIDEAYNSMLLALQYFKGTDSGKKWNGEWNCT